MTTRAEEGLRVDSDTLRYLEKNEPICPRGVLNFHFGMGAARRAAMGALKNGQTREIGA